MQLAGSVVLASAQDNERLLEGIPFVVPAAATGGANTLGGISSSASLVVVVVFGRRRPSAVAARRAALRGVRRRSRWLAAVVIPASVGVRVCALRLLLVCCWPACFRFTFMRPAGLRAQDARSPAATVALED
jgi:hypothetical protein